jgi:hypothetical protein
MDKAVGCIGCNGQDKCLGGGGLVGRHLGWTVVGGIGVGFACRRGA